MKYGRLFCNARYVAEPSVDATISIIRVILSLNMMDFVFKMEDLVFKMEDFVLKMEGFVFKRSILRRV